MPRLIRTLMLAAAGYCLCAVAQTADPASDAPEGERPAVAAFKEASTYSQALRLWRTPDDVNAWIGAKFHYDMARAMALSETQRGRSGRLPIHEAHDFFATPAGICVDLSRFAVETLRQIDPDLQANYLMIEFAPVTVGGNTLRMHWLASFRRDGKYYFFADSKRPGHMAGPYASAQEFIAEYAQYRQRPVVAFRELDSFHRKQRVMAARQSREERRP